MPIITRLLPHLIQPQYPVRVDQSNPLTKGLQIAFSPLGGSLVDAVNPSRIWVPNGNAKNVATQKGIAASLDGVDDYYSHTGYPELTGSTGTFFIFTSRTGAADVNGHVFFGSNTTNSVYFQVDNTGLAIVASAASGTAITWFNEQNACLILTTDGTAAGTKAYKNGQDTGLTWAAAPTAWAAGDKDFNFGRWVGGIDWDTNADIYISGYFNRALSGTEAKSLYDNPWQIFEPRKQNIYVAAAGGTVFTSALGGSLTPSGIIQRLTSRTTSGMIQASSIATKYSVQEVFNGSISPSGALASQLVFVKGVAGSSTPSGSLRKSPLKSLSGSVTASGSLVKLSTRILVGSITATGGILKTLSRTLLGSITATATYVSNYTTTKAAAGSITPSGAVAASKFLTPVATGVGSIIKGLIRFIGK